MIQINCCVDTTQYSVKPSSNVIEYTNKFGHTICQSAAISIRIARQATVCDINQLAQYVSRGQAFTPATFEPQKRSKNNFKQAQLIALDFDNGVPDTWHVEPSLVYESYSSKPSHRKLRAVWVLDEPVTNRIDYEDILRGFAKLYPTVDLACLEGARLLYGTNKAKSVRVTDTVLRTSSLTRVIIPKRELSFTQTDESLSECMARLYFADKDYYTEIRNISNKLEKEVRRCKTQRYPTLFKTVAWFAATEVWNSETAYNYIVNVAKQNPAFFENWDYDFAEVCETAYQWGITKK